MQQVALGDTSSGKKMFSTVGLVSVLACFGEHRGKFTLKMRKGCKYVANGQNDDTQSEVVS